MPLHEDDPDREGNLSDEQYWAVVSEDAQPCPGAVPADVLAAALARLDGESDG